MKKYLFVIPSLSNGGAERAVANFASELVKYNKNVVILKYFDTNHDYNVSSEVKIVNLSGGNEIDYSSIGYYKKIQKIREIIFQENPDYILPFLPHVTIHVWFSVLGTSYNKRVVNTIRNNPSNSPSFFAYRIFRNFIICFSRKIIVQNTEQKQYFPKIIHNKISVLRNIIPDVFFDVKKHTDSVFKIVCVGRLIEQKNYDLLINAIYKVKDELDNFIVEIYGQGQLHDKLQDRIKFLGLDKCIKLMGRNDNVLDVYSSANMYILSSNFEGMPNSLMEAMAVGLPCISTNCPTGPSDLIEHMYNGILIDVNDVEGLSKYILWVRNNYSLAEKLGDNAKITVGEKCKSYVIAKQLISICEK